MYESSSPYIWSYLVHAEVESLTLANPDNAGTSNWRQLDVVRRLRSAAMSIWHLIDVSDRSVRRYSVDWTLARWPSSPSVGHWGQPACRRWPLIGPRQPYHAAKQGCCCCWSRDSSWLPVAVAGRHLRFRCSALQVKCEHFHSRLPSTASIITYITCNVLVVCNAKRFSYGYCTCMG